MLAAAADPSVTYLMGNKYPICQDLTTAKMHAGTETIPNVSPPRSL